MRIGRLEITWLPKKGAEKWNQTWRTATGDLIKVRDLTVNHMRNIIAFILMKAGEGNIWHRRRGTKGIRYVAERRYEDLLRENKVLWEYVLGLEETLYMYWNVVNKHRADARRYNKLITNPHVTISVGLRRAGMPDKPKVYFDSMVDSL